MGDTDQVASSESRKKSRLLGEASEVVWREKPTPLQENCCPEAL